MNRERLVRGVQAIVALTLATFGYLVWHAIAVEKASLALGLGDVHAGWIALAAVLALSEGMLGGLRMFVLCRVLAPELRVRTAILSEFVLMFVGGITPAQLGAPISQVAILVHGGMGFAAVATAEMLTAVCTIVFFLVSAVGVLALRHAGLFVLPSDLDWLMTVSAMVFGSVLALLVVSATWPPLLKSWIRGGAALLSPVLCAGLRVVARVPGAAAFAARNLAGVEHGRAAARLLTTVDDFHAGVAVYRRVGKLAVLAAELLTVGLFWSRFAIAYFLLLGLGISTSPATFVAEAPPFVQVLLVQTVLNFALYLSPTPGASGIAEVGSTTLMIPWVRGAHELPYLVLWRALALFLCMTVGGVYVFRYLGADVLAERVREAEAERLARDA